jgi:hypothetical protein
MDSSCSSSSAHVSMPMQGFATLSSENQLAVLQQVSLQDKPTLRSIANTNRQMHALATPLLTEACIEHVESRIQAMTPGARLEALLLINRKLVENADNLPIMGSATLWARYEALMLKEVGNLAFVADMHKGLENIIRFYSTPDMSLERLVAIQRSIAVFNELGEVYAKAIRAVHAELARAVHHSY